MYLRAYMIRRIGNHLNRVREDYPGVESVKYDNQKNLYITFSDLKPAVILRAADIDSVLIETVKIEY